MARLRHRSAERAPGSQRTVVIVYKTLPHYRVAFFELLKVRLAELGICLRLIIGQPSGEQLLKNDVAEIEWAEFVRSRYLRIGRRELIWQPVSSQLQNADLIVVEQAGRLLLNYWLVVRRLFGLNRLALWGHGLNRNVTASSPVGEWIKRRLLRSCDWWFAYAPSTVTYLEKAGVEPEIITNVENAIDTVSLRTALSELAENDRIGIQIGRASCRERV